MRHRFFTLMLAATLASVGAARRPIRELAPGWFSPAMLFSCRVALTGYAGHHHLIAADRTILVRNR